MSVFKRGNKYWININYDRQRYRYPSPDNTSAGAKAYESILRQRLAKGISIIPGSEKKKETTPFFKEFSEKWVDVYVKTNNKYSEILNKESVLRAHLNPFFGDKQLDRISNSDVENYKAEKMRSGQSNKSINNHLIVLSKCLKTAQDWEVIKDIPKIKLLKVLPQDYDFLSKEECQVLLNNCDGMLQDMILLGLKTGLRFGELIALKSTDISLESGLITIQRSISRGQIGSTKSNKIRHIPLLEDIAQMLSDRAEADNFIFNNEDGKPLIPMTCLRWLHKACDRSGLRKIGWHTLRHTFASHLAQNGVSIIMVKELLGHADIKTTMRYSHLSPSAIKGAIDTLNINNGHNTVTIPDIEENKMPALAPVRLQESLKT